MLEQRSELEKGIIAKDAIVIESLRVAHVLAQTMTSGYDAFWSIPNVLDVLNHNVPSSLEMLTGNAEVGALINAKLDAVNLPQFPCRVPLSMPTGYAFDGTVFTYTAPVPPEPEPPLDNDEDA